MNGPDKAPEQVSGTEEQRPRTGPGEAPPVGRIGLRRPVVCGRVAQEQVACVVRVDLPRENRREEETR